MLRAPVWSVLFSLAASLSAQSFSVDPPGTGPVGGGGGAVEVRKTSVQAEIVDGVATTTIRQVLGNRSDREAEGWWMLPLPKNSVADGFTMTVGDKELAGEVLAADSARAIYERIVRQRRDPGLLEFVGDGLLRARVFPIPARGEVAVTVRLRQVLTPTGGLYEWSWPRRATRLGDSQSGVLGVAVSIRSQTPLSMVTTPNGGASVVREGEHAATLSWEDAPGKSEDPRVLFGLREQEFGLHLLAHRNAGEPGWFTLMLAPKQGDLSAEQLPRRFVQLVVDTSGSMSGPKILQAKAAVRAFLASLRPTDCFQVATFAHATTTFFPTPVPADSEHLAEAMAKVDSLTASGGTNLCSALELAFLGPETCPDAKAFVHQLVFVTDGEPTVGVTSPQQILARAREADRHGLAVFALGVGTAIDVPLLDDLALQHRGARDFVDDEESIEVKVSALCRKIGQPALQDVEVRCDGVDVFEMLPTRVRDVFRGDVVHVVGRYRGHGEHKVVVTGTQNGERREFVFPVHFPEVHGEHAFVAAVWARQHVTALLRELRVQGAKKELVDEVRRLSLAYGIVTPWTSQLILEEEMRLGGSSLQPGGGGGRTGGPAGPSTGGPAGPSTGGPGGPSTGGPPLAGFGGVRTGAEAVRGSRAQDDVGLRDGGDQGEGVRRAGGRTFLLVGRDLVEQGLPADWEKQAETVEAYSDAYFELMRSAPELREILALGDRLVFRHGQRVVRVRPTDVPPPPTK